MDHGKTLILMLVFGASVAAASCGGGEAPLDGGADADGDADQDLDADRDLDSDAEGEIDADAEIDAEIDTGPCGGDCAARLASGCTCAAADPCGWTGDGICDAACLEVPVADRLDDLADCDLDLDGLYEVEELALALRFEPWLWLSVDEEGFRSDRLPHFAVRPTGDGAISIFYALSYFEDYGDPELGGLSHHLGDSEFIVVEVRPDAAGAPELERVFLSAHFENWNDASAWFVPEEMSLEEDDDGGLHPLVYVAEWKHANYRNLGECDLGSFTADHCDEGTLEPVGVEAGRNLGSLEVPLLDEVGLEGNIERYWSPMRFCGWQVPSADDRERGDCCRGYRGLMDIWLQGRL